MILVPESCRTDILKALPKTETDHGRVPAKWRVTTIDARVKLNISHNNHYFFNR